MAVSSVAVLLAALLPCGRTAAADVAPADAWAAVQAAMTAFAYSNAVEGLRVLPPEQRTVESFRMHLICCGQLGMQARQAEPRAAWLREARATAEEGLRLFPSNAEMVVRAGALDLMTSAGSLIPDFSAIEGLVKSCGRALALEPTNALAHWSLGALHYKLATLPAAERVLWRTLAGGILKPSLEQSAAHLQAAAKADPEAILYQVWHGRALAAMGKEAEARAAWRRACQLPLRYATDRFEKREAAGLIADPHRPLPDGKQPPAPEDWATR
jgi:tetratricopeptide (TPR) repeat protein